MDFLKMFYIPDYYPELSLRLSEVLDDIGVNEIMIMKWRNAKLFKETIETMTRHRDLSVYMFGSLSEGTTTTGLDSDSDTLICHNKWKVIQDYNEWQPGLLNLLMIKDDNISAGYCLLQKTRSDEPLADTRVIDRHHVRVNSDRVLLQNTLHKPSDKVCDGPSWVIHSPPGFRSSDFVPAFHCKSWPHEARQWLHRRGVNTWPTSEIKRFAKESGFFVVSVGSKVSQNEALEWRISTSLAERCLMFSLNITQIRCYILLKMILKSYLNFPSGNYISSYMCKTVLLYCIENTLSNIWNEINLISCLSICLQRLSICVLSKNCPHFIIPGNNLMAGKFSGQIKHVLHVSLLQIIQSKVLVLFGIPIDDLGTRLKLKLNMLQHPVPTLNTGYEIQLDISVYNLLVSVKYICYDHRYTLKKSLNDRSEIALQILLQYLKKYATAYRDGNLLEQTASILMTPLICSTIGSIKASRNLQRNNNVSFEALDWLHYGLNSDVSSGRLKLASVLYSMGDMVRTEEVLREIERRYDRQAVQPVCGCYNFPGKTFRIEFAEMTCFKNIVQSIRENIAFCVNYTPAELYCIPHELWYEMFRSTQEDLLLYRNMDEDFWMDWAVVDSLPCLYFLQYKIYGQLQRHVDQQRALNNLIITIMTERNLRHRETAYNLLGQCMEQENRIQDALFCYTRSLDIRGRNNVARFHICRLVATLVNQNVQ